MHLREPECDDAGYNRAAFSCFTVGCIRERAHGAEGNGEEGAVGFLGFIYSVTHRSLNALWVFTDSAFAIRRCNLKTCHSIVTKTIETHTFACF